MFLILKIQENCFFLYSQKQVFENRKQKLFPNITSVFSKKHFLTVFTKYYAF